MQLISDKVYCHVINSGYGEDYGYKMYDFVELICLNGTPTIKVRDESRFHAVYLAWFRNGEWVVDFD